MIYILLKWLLLVIANFARFSNTVLLMFYLDTLQVILCLAIVILFFMLYDCSIWKKKDSYWKKTITLIFLSFILRNF